MINDPIEYIQGRLDLEDLVDQLEEEANELAHAAAKWKRAIKGTNPTPVTEEAARSMVLEEVADVSNALKALNLNRPIPLLEIQKKMNEKLQRWVERLQEKEGRAHDAHCGQRMD